MKALLVIAHGSRKQASNDEIFQLAKELDTLSGNYFDYVRCAFIQFATPLLDDQITALARLGVTHIKLFPYFIGAGNHVLCDIPESLQEARLRYPNVDFELTDHLGKLAGVRQLIIDEVTKL